MQEKLSILLENKRNLLLVIVLLAAIGVSVYLVQVQQIFKSKAAINVNQAFEIKDKSGNVVNCTGASCYTNSDEVQIKLKDIGILEQ